MYRRAFVPALAFVFTYLAGYLVFANPLLVIGPAVVSTGGFLLVGREFNVHWIERPTRMTILSTASFIAVTWAIAFVLPNVFGVIIMWPLLLAFGVPPGLGPITWGLYFGAIQLGVAYCVVVGLLVDRRTMF